MKNQQIIAGIALACLSIGSAVRAQFEVAPAPVSDMSWRTARQLSDEIPATVSARPMTGAEHKMKASGSGPVIYGMMQYSDAWYNLDEGEAYPYGCYAMSKSSPAPFEMYAHSNLRANGGGCYTNAKIHYRMYQILAEEPYCYNWWMVVDTDNWTYVHSPSLSNEDNTIANDMTYDPIGKKIYAAVWGNYDGGATKLATVNADTGVTTEIATLPDLACLASNNFGELYGVELGTGMMYKIDKETGEYVEVGLTGLTPKYAQSASVDPETNVIYWCASLEDGTAGVYTLDTSTGKADLYFNLVDNDEFTCVFIEAPTKGLNAPAAITDFSMATVDGNSTVKFKAPQKAFDGSTLSGALTAKVYCDGKLIESKSVNAGAECNFSFKAGDGRHSITAFVENSIGAGPKTTRSLFTGNDVAAAPKDIKLEVKNNVATLTWNAPTEGLNGGTIDASKLNYTVVRYPGEEIVAENITSTTFTETLPDEMANYYYRVTAFSGESEGGSASSNAWFAGAAMTVPYIQGFDTAESMLGFTLIDGDGDKNTWAYSDFWKAAWSRFNSTEQEDDWMITPPIELKGGKEYTLKFRARAFDGDSPERFEVLMGKASDVASLTKTLVPATITDSETFREYGTDFTADADGVVFIGFHAMSPANSYRLIVDDIELTEGSAQIVPEVASRPATDLKIAFGDDKKISLSWTAPAEDINGNKINPDYLAYTVYRNDGKKIAEGIKNNYLTDTSLADETAQRMVYYQVTPVYGGKEGEAALSEFVVIGESLTVPFVESFAAQSLQNSPWTLSRLSGHAESLWTLQKQASNPDATAQDGDSGFATFVAYDKKAGIRERMTSPKIDLFSADHPVLTFWVYGTTADADETLEVQISHNDNVFETLQTIAIKADANGWKEYSIEIPRKHCKEQTMISFVGTTARGFNIHLDNVQINNGDASLEEYDLQAVALAVPALYPDEEATLTLEVYNNGLRGIDSYRVQLLVNGEKMVEANSSETLEPAGTMNYLFRLTPEQGDLDQTFRFQGKVICDKDTNPDNNVTDEVSVTVAVNALEEIGVATDECFEVYTPSGIRVMDNASLFDLQNLAEGIYVIRNPKRTLKIRK